MPVPSPRDSPTSLSPRGSPTGSPRVVVRHTEQQARATAAQKWSCSSCKVLNRPSIVRCVMCGTQKPEVRLS